MVKLKKFNPEIDNTWWLPITAVNCDKDGHCWHEATDFGRTCCKCGKHMSPVEMTKPTNDDAEHKA